MSSGIRQARPALAYRSIAQIRCKRASVVQTFAGNAGSSNTQDTHAAVDGDAMNLEGPRDTRRVPCACIKHAQEIFTCGRILSGHRRGKQLCLSNESEIRGWLTSAARSPHRTLSLHCRDSWQWMDITSYRSVNERVALSSPLNVRR